MKKKLRELTAGEIHAFRQHIVEGCTPPIARATIPLYGQQHGRLVHNGSGVLFQIADTYFLISAAHVMDFATIHGFPYFVPPIEQGAPATPLNKGLVLTSPIPPHRDPKDPGMRDDDPLDIAVCELPSEIAMKMLPVRRFARLTEVDKCEEHKPACYLVMGYPLKYFEPDHEKNKVFSKPLRYVTELYKGERDDRDREADILLIYIEEGIDGQGNTIPLPPPQGLSGCGIWRLADPEKPMALWNANDMKLVGVQHRWRSQLRYARGTSIAYAMKLIHQNYPSLRPALELEYATIELQWKI